MVIGRGHTIYRPIYASHKHGSADIVVTPYTSFKWETLNLDPRFPETIGGVIVSPT